MAPAKYGRSGSNVVASPAPLSPKNTATNGPAQHTADPMAATTPPVAARAALPTNDGTVLQGLQDGAFLRKLPCRTGVGQLLERSLDALEVSNPLFDQVDLLPSLALHGVAGGAAPNPEGEQLVNLFKREPELLGVLDEP